MLYYNLHWEILSASVILFVQYKANAKPTAFEYLTHSLKKSSKAPIIQPVENEAD
jgi:hypothetical protein